MFNSQHHATMASIKLRAGTILEPPPSVGVAASTGVSQSSTINHNDNNNSDSYDWTRQNLALIVPAWLGLVADPLLRVIDTLLVSRMGSTDLAALGVGSSIFNMAFGIFLATTMATTSLVASSAHQKEQAKEITIMSFKLALLVGTMVLMGLRWGSSWILSSMGVDKASSHLDAPARQYLRTRCWAAPAVLLIMVAEGTFRGLGDTRIPLLASLTAALINLVLDPILIFGLDFGVAGAAAATAIAQLGAVAVYFYYLKQRHMLPKLQRPAPRPSSEAYSTIVTTPDRNQKKRDTAKSMRMLRSILSANLSMLTKQGSTVLFYTFAAALATRLGNDHVAAHQVGLSIWLLFTFLLDAASVSGQVLMSQAVANSDHNPTKVKSLTQYMIRWAIGQGMVSMLGMMLVRQFLVPQAFTQDPLVQGHLIQMMPWFLLQQVLISLVLVMESLVVGARQFQWMAIGTTLCTLVAAMRMQQTATSVVSIWSQGFSTLFLLRLVSATLGLVRVLRK